MRCEYIPYKTLTFVELWPSVDEFLADFKSSPFYTTATGYQIDDTQLTLTFYLLFSRYGNSPIANNDVNQAKFKFFATIWQYGPIWQQKLQIQAKLRSLGLDSTSPIFQGSRTLYNHAYHDETNPATDSGDYLPYIDDQNVTKYQKSILEGLASLNELLSANETDTYLRNFRKIFKIFVDTEDHTAYVTDDEGDVILL